MKFSQRMGITPISKPIQLESLDLDLRNSLWNVFNSRICTLFQLRNYGISLESQHESLARYLWHNLYKQPIDIIPRRQCDFYDFFREKILSADWYITLEFIEEVILYLIEKCNVDTSQIILDFNNVFEREFSGYRFINGLIAPISNNDEISELEESFNNTKPYTALNGCNIHLAMALSKLSDKLQPDYRNSIKESISAVESLAKVIAGREKDSLGASLDRLRGIVGLHPALERAFKQLYGYTSDEGGIRHAMMNEPNCDFEDAKFMLISCSAFINYLIRKANKAKLLNQP